MSLATLKNNKALKCILCGQKSFNEYSHLKVVDDPENIMEHL